MKKLLYSLMILLATCAEGNAVTTSGAVTSVLAKAGAGQITTLTVASPTNNFFVMLFDATGQPRNGTVIPLAVWGPLPALTDINFLGAALSFSSGLTIVCSSTGTDTSTGITTLTATACYKIVWQVQ